MIERLWCGDQRKTIVCVDSYHKGNPEGRMYIPSMEVESFESLSEFLVKMESMLDELKSPQAYTQTRTFTPLAEQLDNRPASFHVPKGARATFEVRIIFRQHTSWQGVIIWLDRNVEQSFRSVLELVLLMDSALRTAKGSDTA